MAAVDTGDLDTRVRFDRPVPDLGVGQEGVGTWEPVFTRWASLVDDMPSRSERQADGQLMTSSRTRVRVKYTKEIGGDFRIAVGDLDKPDEPKPAGRRYLSIVAGPATLGNREWTEMMAEEYGTEGTGV